MDAWEMHQRDQDYNDRCQERRDEWCPRCGDRRLQRGGQ